MDIRSRVLYRDPLMLVLDKPAGIPVHAGPGGAPSLEDEFGALRFGQARDPALAHRLDRDTSGCLVLGRHRKALRKLWRLFASGRIEKVYWAVTRGRPARDEGRIEAPLRKRTERGKGWRMEIDPGGAAAVTDWRVRAEADGLAWLELRPRTGRTHQVRVHCAALGCPVLGDALYGRETGIVPPLHLHARAVAVPLYANREPIMVVAPPPDHMSATMRARLEYGRRAAIDRRNCYHRRQATAAASRG
ncbi:MAG: RNA pseudouridine synthase [Acidimicrobiia bacterium]|nr:RNA pseudouridine synthase [Acidimicrobiia bacterium]